MNSLFTITGEVPLDHWGVIRAQGADATKFLQSQLTNDVAALSPAQVRLAGFCSAKGRLQASFLVWRVAADELYLACSASVLAAALKRLSMFVLRAQCRLTDATAQSAPCGQVGSVAAATAAGAAVWGKREGDGRTVLRLPDAAGLARCIVIGDAAAAHVEPTSAITLDHWRWLEVQSGIPTIEAATVDQFVPQMLNFELLDGIDFHKGCYPGQEVVARSQYRGSIKRRMFLFDCAAAAAAGQEVFASHDPGQPAGMVVNAAPHPAGGWSALVQVKLLALTEGTLHLGDAEGALLQQRELPYPVPTGVQART